jgi:pre-mRNA-processing factor 6
MARREPKTFGGGPGAPGAPQHYVAGLGRGAIGFTTRVDVGPALAGGAGRGAGAGAGRGRGAGAGAGSAFPDARTQFGAAPAGYVAGAGRGTGGFGETKPQHPGRRGGGGGEADDDEGGGGDGGGGGGYDAFDGFGGSLFKSSEPYDDADREADRVWDAVDARMADRRRPKRRAGDDNDVGAEDGASASETGARRAPAARGAARIADQFADLKQQLATVSYAEWDALPEAMSGVRAQKRAESTVPVSDAIILGARGGQSASTVQDAGEQQLSLERGRMLLTRLDGSDAAGAPPGAGDVDQERYLSGLDASQGSAAAQVGDMSKARLLLRSVTQSNPGHAPGWIAAARLEEAAGKLGDARKLIAQGCASCPGSDDVWLEAARLNTPENAKVLLERAVQALPRGSERAVRVWLAAADLESGDAERQRRVLRRALEAAPQSERLWKQLVALEADDADALLVLAKAVECVPASVDLWLALARLEEYGPAQQVLNRARKACPAEPRIWAAALALEEAKANAEQQQTQVQQAHAQKRQDESESQEDLQDAAEAAVAAKLLVIADKAVSTLPDVARARWLELAREAEVGNPQAARALVRASLDLEAPGEETPTAAAARWAADAEAAIVAGAPATARWLHLAAVERFEASKAALARAVAFEGKRGDKKSLLRLLRRATRACPAAELFWLMAAKESWKGLGDVAAARAFLARAFDHGHDKSERIWLAAAKLEWETGEEGRARALLAKARAQAPSAAVFAKSALLERVVLSRLRDSKASEQDQDQQRAIVAALLEQGRAKFPASPKLWMMSAQLESEFVTEPLARAKPVSDPALLASAERARQLLAEGLRHCPAAARLWVLAARHEERYASAARARSVLEIARLKNAASGELWAETVALERRAGQHQMAQQQLAKALKECPKEGELWAHAILGAAKADRRATSADALERCGDHPHVLLALANLFKDDHKRPQARKWFEKAVEAGPHFGDAWAAYYEFELADAQGARLAADVLERCVRAAPNRGERWLAVAKLDAYRLKGTAEVLQAVVKAQAPPAGPR